MSNCIGSLALLVALTGGALFAGGWPPAGSTEEKLVQHARSNAGDATAGRKLFTENRLGCMSCHGQPGKGGDIGPDLAGAGKRFGREELMKKVLSPRPGSAMPTQMAKDFNSGQEFTNLIAYLASLR